MSIIEDVREAVLAIPAGFVASYGDIGNRIGAGPRQVGRAMSLLDDSVPWWRVVYADGTPASAALLPRTHRHAHDERKSEGQPDNWLLVLLICSEPATAKKRPFGDRNLQLGEPGVTECDRRRTS